MRAFAIVAAIVVATFALGGCHGPSLPMSRAPGNPACGDPCAAMVCPSGNVCSWNDRCQPRCDPQPLPNFSR
jgi:hypothetical protein